MDQNKGVVWGSIILAITAIICVSMFKDAYMKKSVPQPQTSIPYINADVSKLEGLFKNQDKDALTVAEAASYLGIKQEIFTYMVYNEQLKDLPYVNLGGSIVFSKKALDEWIYNSSKSHVVISP